MSDPHLLLIAIGPVQDFIAQARRTRDLWFGSHLLSELSRAAAGALAEQGAMLIFPALDPATPEDAAELVACDTPTRPGSDTPPLSIANKILAGTPAGIDPLVCLRAARKAVRERWRRISGSVRAARHSVLADTIGIDDIWYEQIDDVLEFYATWAPRDHDDDYKDARNALEQTLAGRKNLRDFSPWRHGGALPKSSLDGARVSVLRQDGRTHADFRRFGIRTGEQLDAVGLVKRTGFEPEQFIPLVNVAAGAWLRRAATTAAKELDAAVAACAARKIPRVDRRLAVIRPFGFDASVLYRSRWPAVFEELAEPEPTAAARLWGAEHIGPLLDRMKGGPPPYVACLVADGDHMGKAIDSLADEMENQWFSRALARFLQQARQIVEDDHFGSLVYAGGDDVLAFLPVATAVACAEQLAAAFRSVLSRAVSAELAPTLSVGVGIGHMMEAMESLLSLGRDAERAAKSAGRNALAVICDKRGGGRRQFAHSWTTDPVRRLRDDATLLADRLSTGKAHELEALLNRFPAPASADPAAESLAVAFVAYANDALAHTGEQAAVVTLDDLGITGVGMDYTALHGAVRTMIDRILVVRTMREAGFR